MIVTRRYTYQAGPVPSSVEWGFDSVFGTERARTMKENLEYRGWEIRRNDFAGKLMWDAENGTAWMRNPDLGDMIDEIDKYEDGCQHEQQVQRSDETPSVAKDIRRELRMIRDIVQRSSGVEINPSEYV